MKKALLIIPTLLISLYFANAQEVTKQKQKQKLCKNEYGFTAILKKNAKYVRLTTKEPDGTKQYEIRDLKTNQLVSLERYKKNTPVGTWKTMEGQELNYDFELVYNKEEYTGILKYDIYGNKPVGELKGKFEAPVFPEFGNNFRLYIAENLIYPVKAIQNDIQGNVVTQFIIDEEGKVVNLSILDKAHKMLNKEAARAILDSPEWEPAKIDGKPVKVYVEMRNTFFIKLEEE